MSPENRAWPLMGTAGAVLGMVAAFGTHCLVSWLRRAAPLPLAVVGWLAMAFLAATVLYLIVNSRQGKDPTGMSLILVFAGLLLLAVVGGLAAMHFTQDGVTYAQACGHLTALFGGAVLLCYLLARVLPKLTARLHGVAVTDERMMDRFPPIHFAADWLYGMYLGALILLEIFRPCRYWFRQTLGKDLPASPFEPINRRH